MSEYHVPIREARAFEAMGAWAGAAAVYEAILAEEPHHQWVRDRYNYAVAQANLKGGAIKAARRTSAAAARLNEPPDEPLHGSRTNVALRHQQPRKAPGQTEVVAAAELRAQVVAKQKAAAREAHLVAAKNVEIVERAARDAAEARYQQTIVAKNQAAAIQQTLEAQMAERKAARAAALRQDLLGPFDPALRPVSSPILVGVSERDTRPATAGAARKPAGASPWDRSGPHAVPSQNAPPRAVRGTAASRAPQDCPFARPEFDRHEDPRTQLAAVRKRTDAYVAKRRPREVAAFRPASGAECAWPDWPPPFK